MFILHLCVLLSLVLADIPLTIIATPPGPIFPAAIWIEFYCHVDLQPEPAPSIGPGESCALMIQTIMVVLTLKGYYIHLHQRFAWSLFSVLCMKLEECGEYRILLK